MTREEAIEMIASMGKYMSSGNPIWKTEPVKEATDMAIEALSAEATTGDYPNDLISRSALMEYCSNQKSKSIDNNDIARFPSAEARPTGEWIKATGMMPPEFHGHHCCSECGNFANMDAPYGNREGLSNYCPNCGAAMKQNL